MIFIVDAADDNGVDHQGVDNLSELWQIKINF